MIETYANLDALPRALRIYGASDYATMEPDTAKREPDYTEHGVVGLDAIGDLWFLDWWFDQCETDKGIAAFIKLVGQHKPIKWFNEGGLIDKAIGPAIRQAMRINRTFVAIESLSILGDKAVKLQAFHARAAARTCHFPIRRAWTDHVIEQLIKFPGGRWDDAADVCGLIGRGVDKMFEASVSLPERRPLLIPFTEKWLEYNDRNEKPKVRYF
jgi:predicted phage terminase large subunit-like protein